MLCHAFGALLLANRPFGPNLRFPFNVCFAALARALMLFAKKKKKKQAKDDHVHVCNLPMVYLKHINLQHFGISS